RWLDDLQPPENVFTLLSLDKGGASLLANPQLRTWVQYAERYKENNPFTTKLTLFAALKAHYRDRVLVKMVNSATVSSSKRDILYAEYVLNGLLGRYAWKGKSLRKVLKKLLLTPEKAKAVTIAYRTKLLELTSK
ncbi:Avirulence (Avh) protein, partial [Phytophthora megakarya]